MADRIDAVVIGAGQAGVCLSHRLKQRGIEHVVLERDEPFSTFRRTWAAFLMNTPNFANALPDAPVAFAPGKPRNDLGTRQDCIDYLEAYLAMVDPPLRTEEVVEARREDGRWRVTCRSGAELSARALAVCTGISARPVRPEALATALPEDVPQVHAHDYRQPEDLARGRVVVVGSGASGTQIARDLAESKRFDEVVLACSDVPILPKKLFGLVPTFWLLEKLGLSSVRRDTWIGRRMREKLLSGGQGTVEPGPEQLARDWGVRCVGRLAAVEDGVLRFDDEGEVSAVDASVVWCTGYSYDWSFLGLDDRHGEPAHERGVSAEHDDLYFLGLKFQYRVNSHLIGGIGADVDHVAERIAEGA